jgi:dienelactone hydrolase
MKTFGSAVCGFVVLLACFQTSVRAKQEVARTGRSPDAVDAFEEAMKTLGEPVDAKIDPDAGHAFENPMNKTGYRPQDTADAQGRTARFFEQKLGR